jgi:hypothetical protein
MAFTIPCMLSSAGEAWHKSRHRFTYANGLEDENCCRLASQIHPLPAVLGRPCEQHVLDNAIAKRLRSR